MDETEELSYGEKMAVERTAKQLALLRRRVYKTIEDVEQHVLDWLDHAYDTEFRGVSLVELNRRYGRATQQFGITPVDILERLNNRHKILSVQYKTATTRGTIVVALKFQRRLDALFEDAKGQLDFNIDDIIGQQEDMMEQMKLRTLGLIK